MTMAVCESVEERHVPLNHDGLGIVLARDEPCQRSVILFVALWLGSPLHTLCSRALSVPRQMCPLRTTRLALSLASGRRTRPPCVACPSSARPGPRRARTTSDELSLSLFSLAFSLWRRQSAL